MDRSGHEAYIILLFVHVSDLEPDVRVGKGIWGTLKDLLEAAKTFLVFAALLIDYAQSKKDFIGLVEVQVCKESNQSGHICPTEEKHTLVHPEDRGEGFFGMIQGPVAIVKNTDAIPQFGIIL